MPAAPLPEWDNLLSSAAHLQRILPSAVLVGGSAAALHVHHRYSRDADHVLTDLRQRFDEILADLEETRLDEYKDLVSKWQDWANVESVAAGIADLILDHLP